MAVAATQGALYRQHCLLTYVPLSSSALYGIECILYTWDYHTALSVYNALRVLPILSDEIMTFKALILVHKVIQEGHACAIKEGQNQIGWLETCSRTMGSEGARGERSFSYAAHAFSWVY